MESLRISIVTLSYNQAAYLPDAIRSVISQNYPRLEYVIVDPGSTDGSRAIISSSNDLIHHCVLDPDSGPSQGLNRGFAKTTGEILGFINADDLLLPGALQFIDNYFRQHPHVDVLLGCGRWVDAASYTLRRVVPSKYSFGAARAGRFEFIQQGVFFRRRAFAACGGFNEKNTVSWDGELIFDLARCGARFGRCSRELGAFRLYMGTITDSKDYLIKLRREEARIYGSVDGQNELSRASSFFWLVRKWLFDPWYVFFRVARNII